MANGTRVHQLAQDFTEGKLKKLPPELQTFKVQFQALKKIKATCELDWAFTSLWSPCEWIAKNTWLRVKADATYAEGNTRRVIDHKTGRAYDDHPLQLELYALAALIMHPETESVIAEDWYLDQGAISDPTIYTRAQLPELKAAWERRVAPMLRDTIFPARPGSQCNPRGRFSGCAYCKANGGPCVF